MRVAINGFGRIGRLAFKQLLNSDSLDVVAINDLTDNATLLHLLKYDTTHGIFDAELSLNQEGFQINDESVKVLSEADPNKLPWSDLEVDIVLECTGRFRSKEDCLQHINAGAKGVIISAPPKGDDVPTFVLGVNDQDLTIEMQVISNASCTTNCLAPMIKILDDEYGIEEGFITTVHAYTADQRLQDAPHKDLRRARNAAQNIIPTSTGAAKATTKVIPHLKGKLNANAYRVPVMDGSLTDVTVKIKKAVSRDDINALFKSKSQNEFKDIIRYTDEPLVSSDIIGDPHSTIYDSELCEVQDQLIKIVGWYDNENGYATRLVDMTHLYAKIISA